MRSLFLLELIPSSNANLMRWIVPEIESCNRTSFFIPLFRPESLLLMHNLNKAIGFDALTEALNFYVALDLSRNLLGFMKAFDTINHETLLKKSELYAASRVAWLHSFFFWLIGCKWFRLINRLVWWQSVEWCHRVQ